MLPAPAQGAIGIEIRKTDTQTAEAIKSLNHGPTHLTITAERAFLQALDGSCRTPIAALAKIKDGGLAFRGEVIAKDGSLRFTRSETLQAPAFTLAHDLGLRLGRAIKDEIGGRIIWDEA